MGLIKEKLFEVSTRSDETINKTIAKELMKNYDDGTFMSIEELSKKVFVVKSVITKFSKEIGYSGYRELIYRAKFEKENYYSLKNNTIDIEGNENELSFFNKNKNKIFNLLSYYNYYDTTIEQIANEIKKHEKIIFVYPQIFKDEVIFFSSLLNVYGKMAVIFENHLFEYKILSSISSNDLVFFFNDKIENTVLVNIYNEMIQKTENIILFTDLKNSEVFNVFKERVVYYDIEFKTSNLYLFKMINFYLIGQILHHIK